MTIQVRNAPDKRDGAGLWLRSYREDGIRYHTRSGCLWNSIETRTKVKFQSTHDTYVGVFNGFESFQHFASWCQSVDGYGRHDDNNVPWNLDKDLLGGKCYSATTCLFIPHSLNTAIADHSPNLVKGVRVAPSTGKFTARHPAVGHIGTFDTELQARLAFVGVKSSYIRALCIKENLNSATVQAVEDYLNRLEV